MTRGYGGTEMWGRNSRSGCDNDSALSSRYFLLTCDRIVRGGLLFLVFFTPLAFGSVHPWAFSLMEGVVFLLVMVWMGKLLFLACPFSSSVASRSLFLPSIFFIGFILFQLLPLPPSLLRHLSPATSELYSRSLPGWPQRMPYAEFSSQMPDNAGTDLQPASNPYPQIPTPGPRSPIPILSLWRPLSIAPSLTYTSLLKLCAYASLFFLVLLYPFGRSPEGEAEERFFRSVLRTVLFIGLLVAAIGLVQRFAWNGKILWVLVPYDWGIPHPETVPRASGPFVNSDHFANYLALVFPLALVGTLSRRFLAPEGRVGTFRLLCGFVVVLLLAGILLSLSRGGWGGTALGVGILLWVFLSLPQAQRPSLLRRSKGPVVRFSLVGFSLFLVLALLFVGPSGRSQVDVRLEETVMKETTLEARVAAWEASLGMIRDFPLFGVGLGSWQEIFPRYQRLPWSSLRFGEAHNDYLEFFAEIGLIGFGLLAWFFWQGGRILYHGLQGLSSQVLPVFAALLSALGVMAFHEVFDFNLQIPANAFLFTLLLGVALRLAGWEVKDQGLGSRGQGVGIRGRFQTSTAVGVGIVAMVLCILALRQERIPYPYNLKEPTSLAEAREALFAHPASSSAHFSLFTLLQDRVALSDRLQELEIALWLDPGDSEVRDLYATSLLQQGREEKGLEEMTQSVLFAPALSDHSYLDRQRIAELSAKEQRAVEDGFKQALAVRYEEVVSELGAFYASLGRFSDEGALYEEAALQGEETAVQVRYFLNAGLAYIRASMEETAEVLFRRAALASPTDPKPYHYLATLIFAARGDLDSAKAVISEGIKKGADPFSLSLSLAEAAQQAGEREEAKTALLQALALRPSSFEVHFRLGLLYLQERNFDRAALSLRKAVDLNPHSASAFYNLGVAEEGRYQFLAAENAYARALELAPDNTGFQRQYEVFLRKVAEASKG